MRLPDEYLDRIKHLLGDEFDDYLAALDGERLYGLRVNTTKISPADFEKISPFPIKKIPYINNGYFYDGEKYQPSKHPYYFAGLYYLQDPSAMTPASRLPIRPGDRVLDLCAAPGGKSTELAARLNGEGILVANDISASRAKALHKNIELFGVTNSLITTEYPEKLSERFDKFFDAILIDAPCSGEGMFRKDPAMVKSWSPDSPGKYAAMQEDILRHALPMLADGGCLLYSTCTFSPEEDEGSVMKALAMDPSLRLVSMEGYEGFASGRPDVIPNGVSDLEKCVRIFPHRMDGEGHFLALFKKNETNDQNSSDNKTRKNNSGKAQITKEEKELWEGFAAGLNIDMAEGGIESHDGKLYLTVPGLPDTKGLRFIRSGLYLGECKKKRFEPSQALAMAIKKDNYKNTLDMPVSDDRVNRYLKGETISVSADEADDGLTLICVDGYPLGWGKKSGSTIKNKYHTGWRMM